MTVSFSLPAVLGLFCFMWLAHQYRQSRRLRGHVLPPGPKRLPVIGNLLDLPAKEPWGRFHDFAAQYGDIVYIEALGNPMLVVSSPEVAFDLLDKRSAIYSDRPASLLDEIVGWEWNLGLLPYGQRWRNTRRCFHQYFNQQMSLKYRDTQMAEARWFLSQILQADRHVSPPLIRHMLARTISEVVYGMPVKGMDDDYIQCMEVSARELNEAKLPGAYWIDFLPILKHVPAWVPGAKAQQLGARLRPLARQARNQGFDYAKANKDSKDCIVSDFLERMQSEEGAWLIEDTARDATGIAYAAGVDTTLAFLSFSFSAMAMHPDFQKKAQAELDRVVGTKRLPDFDDFESLHYIRAILLECTRWTPVTPLGVPHRVIRDDFYEQYFIPEGTLVFSDVRHMLRNPEEYSEPERFNPDRFLKDGKLNPEVRDPTTLSFGFGRRICPGRYFTKDYAFIVLASVLHVYTIHPSVDEDGLPLDPTPTSGIIAYVSYQAGVLTDAALRSSNEFDRILQLARGPFVATAAVIPVTICDPIDIVFDVDQRKTPGLLVPAKGSVAIGWALPKTRTGSNLVAAYAHELLNRESLLTLLGCQSHSRSPTAT